MYDRHMPITDEDGEHRLSTSGGEIVDSAPKCRVVADEVNDGNASVDLSVDEPTKGCKTIAAVDVQLAIGEILFR